MGGNKKTANCGCDIKDGNTLKRPVSTNDKEITIRAHIREQKRNIIIIDATLADSNGNICTEVTCTYFAFSREKAEKNMHFRPCELENEK